MDAELLNWIATQPDVQEGLPESATTLPPGFFENWLSQRHNVAFGDARGAVLFQHRGDGVYEVHYLLTKSLRGRVALQFIARWRDALFTIHNAKAIVGSTPRMNRAARAMNRALGGVPCGVSIDKLGRPCIDYILERDKCPSLATLPKPAQTQTRWPSGKASTETSKAI